MQLQALVNQLGLPTTAVLSRMVAYWQSQVQPGFEAQILPDEKIYASFAEWMAEKADDGITPARALGAVVRRMLQNDVEHWKENPFYWAEMSSIDEPTIINLYGQLQYNRMAGENDATRRARKLWNRLQKRYKQLRYAAIFGSLSVDSNGVKRTVSYGVQTPTAPSVLWDDVDADIPTDIASYLGTFDGYGAGNVRMVYGRDVANALAKNSVVRDLSKQSGLALNLNPYNVGNSLMTNFTGLKGCYFEEGGYLDSGAFAPWIPAKKVAFVCDTPDGEPIGNLCHTLTLGGGMVQPGPYSQVNDLLKEEKCIEIEVGSNCIPVIKHPKCIAVVTVLT